MGQSILKSHRRALRRTAREEKNNIVSRYMTDNWDKVLVSSVTLIRQFNFKNRFQIAMTIIFKPIKKERPQKPAKAGGAAKDSGGVNGIPGK